MSQPCCHNNMNLKRRDYQPPQPKPPQAIEVMDTNSNPSSENIRDPLETHMNSNLYNSATFENHNVTSPVPGQANDLIRFPIQPPFVNNPSKSHSPIPGVGLIPNLQQDQVNVNHENEPVSSSNQDSDHCKILFTHEKLIQDDVLFGKLRLPCQIGKYYIYDITDKSFNGDIYTCSALDRDTSNSVVCKVIRRENEKLFTQPYLRTSHKNVAQIKELLIDQEKSLSFIIFDKSFGDLHNYIRTKKRLRELEAISYFKQILTAVHHCHERGLSLRDLKLKRFTFMDEEKCQLRLEGLEEANIIDNEDKLSSIDRADKIACPAYVCPELLTLEVGKPFNGQAADIWSCGVMMYTMILGKYPFNGQSPILVFAAIRKGLFDIPDTVSSRAKCLIRNMMKRDPNKRWSAFKALHHPWFERITYANYDQDCKIPERNDCNTINSSTPTISKHELMSKLKNKKDDHQQTFFVEIEDCMSHVMN